MSDLLYIRADANETIAMGHIMRCLSIADAFEALGGRVEFLIADDFVCDLLESRGYSYQILETDWKDMEGELEKLKQILDASEEGRSKGEKPKLLVDSYQATERYFQCIRSFADSIYLDDLNRFKAPVSMLVNYVSFQKVHEATLYAGSDTRLCLGWQYTPLRLAFADSTRKEKKEVTDILITTGGSDPYEISVQLAEAFLQRIAFSELHFHIVCGRFCQCVDKLQQLAAKSRQVTVYQNVENMAELMCQCDLAVSAGGTTLFELFASRVPVIAFGFADNQLESLRYLKEQRALVSIGDIRGDMEQGIQKIAAQAEVLCRDENTRRKYAAQGYRVTDGQGAFRIAKAIQDLYKAERQEKL
jgi:UDP-2,4-diacetamido-2,4,6-trideoxy-beta-L-altropyranose hydrolase